MICFPCQQAGQLLTEILRLEARNEQIFITERWRKQAEQLHERCPGGTHCDCQHKLDASVNRVSSSSSAVVGMVSLIVDEDIPPGTAKLVSGDSMVVISGLDSDGGKR